MDIGAPVTTQNINAVIAWATAESGAPGHNQGHGGWTNYNPLNVVVQSGDQHVSQGGTQGNIADFASPEAGAAASARLFLNNANASGIINALRGDQGVVALYGAVQSFYSTWGGSIANFTGMHVDPNATIGGTHQAQLTGFSWSDAIDTVSPALGVIHAFGGDPAKILANLTPGGAIILKAFDNWPYILEVFLGVLMSMVGLAVIMFDTGALSKLPAPVPVPV